MRPDTGKTENCKVRDGLDEHLEGLNFEGKCLGFFVMVHFYKYYILVQASRAFLQTKNGRHCVTIVTLLLAVSATEAGDIVRRECPCTEVPRRIASRKRSSFRCQDIVGLHANMFIAQPLT